MPPPRTATSTPSAAQRPLPDFVSSPGQAQLFAEFLKDYRDVLRQRGGENPSRFDAIHQGLVETGAAQLERLHAAPAPAA